MVAPEKLTAVAWAINLAKTRESKVYLMSLALWKMGYGAQGGSSFFDAETS